MKTTSEPSIRKRKANLFTHFLCCLSLSPLLMVLPVAAQEVVGSGAELDRIVAIVNSDVITLSELENKINIVLTQIRQGGTRPPARAVLYKQVLEKLIFEHLQMQKAREMGLRPNEGVLNAAVRQIAARNQLSVAELKSVMEKDGYDFSSFREDIRRQITLEQLRRRQVENRVKVTDREIDDLLATQARQGSGGAEYHIAHILIATPDRATPEEVEQARAKAQAVLKRIQEGGAFQELASTVSDGRQALDGGDLGWFKPGKMPSLFANVAIDMKAGDISELLHNPSGFHIIKLLEIRQGERHMVNQTQVRHILIKTNELTSNEDARGRLEQLKQRLEGGDNFGDLARANSNDPGSSMKGGELGWVNPGDLVPQFEAVMDSLEPGEISEPFQSPFGWHIVEVLGRREHDNTEVVRRTKARQAIRERKVEEEFQNWLSRLRDEAYVEYRLEEQ